jgi:hypothetical protein
MPRGVYERKPKGRQLADKLRVIADEIEAYFAEEEETYRQLRKLAAIQETLRDFDYEPHTPSGDRTSSESASLWQSEDEHYRRSA